MLVRESDLAFPVIFRVLQRHSGVSGHTCAAFGQITLGGLGNSGIGGLRFGDRRRR